MYNKIYELCTIKNRGTARLNGVDQTPRVEWICELLKSLNLDYQLDTFQIDNQTLGFNIILPGTSEIAVTAHHDIVNPLSDNANDNSASIINAIAIKLAEPSTTVILLDAEEIGGLGARAIALKINNDELGPIEMILNLELTGAGGAKFFIDNHPGRLSDHIQALFNCPTIATPFNDAVIFRRHGIDSVVINPLPVLESGQSSVKWNQEYLDSSLLYNCHTLADSIETINPIEMQQFVEQVCLPIIRFKN